MLPLLLIAWVPLADGVDYRTLENGTLHVVRIDAAKAKLVVDAASASDGKNRTAAEWAKERDRVAVINAGMYHTDFSTHVGYMRIEDHVNSERWDKRYKSLFVIDDGVAKIVDANTLPKNGDVMIQNLRLIAGPGKNVWTKQPKRWSEAALAMDRKGRILFLFSRVPMSMWAFNRVLLKSGLGVTHAQHLEGGPEASLSIRSKAVNLDLCGSFETGFVEDDSNRHQWRLPNVLSVQR